MVRVGGRVVSRASGGWSSLEQHRCGTAPSIWKADRHRRPAEHGGEATGTGVPKRCGSVEGFGPWADGA